MSRHCGHDGQIGIGDLPTFGSPSKLTDAFAHGLKTVTQLQAAPKFWAVEYRISPGTFTDAFDSDVKHLGDKDVDENWARVAATEP